MAYLYHIKPGGQPECWTISEKPLVLGRGEFVDAYVEDDALSRSHFLVVSEHDEFFIIDLNSSNGTWIGDDLVCARKLAARDIIQAGDSTFCFSREPIGPELLPTALTLPRRRTPSNDQLSAA